MTTLKRRTILAATTATLAAGSHAIGATYAGTPNFAGSSATSATQTVTLRRSALASRRIVSPVPDATPDFAAVDMRVGIVREVRAFLGEAQAARAKEDFPAAMAASAVTTCSSLSACRTC